MKIHDLTVTQAEYDVCKERTRQVVEEGWSAEHDDHHANGEMAVAAACYAHPKPEILQPGWPLNAKKFPKGWPWSLDWWKPTDRRRDLVKAAALIIAEIERLDRLSTPQSISEQDPADDGERG